MTSAVKKKGGTKELKGLAINSGKVVAQVCLYSVAKHMTNPGRTITGDDEVKHEIGRFEQALNACSAELDKISLNVAERVGKTEAEIFTTQKHIMNDPAIVNAIKKGVTQGRQNVEKAISDVFSGYEEKFAQLDNEYLRERSSDIGEIRRRLLGHLNNTRPGFVCRGQEHCLRGEDRIIVAEELTADMMVHMALERVLGIVTEHGGISSHAAIIARSVGVPAVSGIRGIFSQVECGTEILLDGDTGTVVVEPDEDTVKRLVPVEPVPAEDVCMLTSPEGTMALANASIIEDVRLAASVHADGIGLFRTEILFMQAGRLLSADEQFDYYAQVLNLMGDRPVTFRLLDVGGDKELPFMQIEKESNPYLGRRGARFLLGSSDIFAAQVKALVRLSRLRKVEILFPMVIDSRQLELLCAGVREIMVTEETIPENIRLGAMFEVPSACIQAESILKQVDFGSIGSNDLIQYLFAVDRDNELVSQDYNPEHPVLWGVLSDLSKTARDAGKPLSICGEMAGRKGMPTRFLDIGIKILSVSPRQIPRVRNEMAHYDSSYQMELDSHGS